MGWTFPDNEIPINSRITFGAAWNDVDLGANNDVPAGTKGVALHVRNTGGSAYNCNVRYNGAADNRAVTCSANVHGWLVIGLDASRIFEGYFENSGLDVSICAYTSDDRFFASATEFANTGNDTYEDLTLTQNGAKAAWLEITGTTSAYNFALRKKGVSFESYKAVGGSRTPKAFTCFAGLDNNRKAEHKTASYTNVKHYLWGWASDEIVALDTPIKKQADQASAWRDIDCNAEVPGNTLGVILQIVNTSASNNRGVNIRKKGSTDNKTTSITLGLGSQIFALVGVDNSRVFQAYTNNIADIELWLVGYVLPTQVLFNAGNISGAEVFGTPTVTPGATTLSAAGNIAGAEAWGTPQVVPGPVTLAPAQVLSEETCGTPQIISAGAVILYPAGVPSAEIWGVPGLTPAQSRVFPDKLSLNLHHRTLGSVLAVRRLTATPQITRLQVTPDA